MLTTLFTLEMKSCSENNGGCEDQCEEGNAAGEVVCSCSIPGTILSANAKSCVGEEIYSMKEESKEERKKPRYEKERKKERTKERKTDGHKKQTSNIGERKQ